MIDDFVKCETCGKYIKMHLTSSAQYSAVYLGICECGRTAWGLEQCVYDDDFGDFDPDHVVWVWEQSDDEDYEPDWMW